MDLSGYPTPASALLPELAVRIAHPLSMCVSTEEARSTLDEVLVTQLEAAACPDELVRRAVDAIVDSGGNVSVADLARRLGISERQFQRRFRKAVGITPKQFSRIRRFRACVVNMITEEPEAWGRVAVRSGYADQAHLIRELVRLSGRPPTALDAYIRGIDHGDVDP